MSPMVQPNTMAMPSVSHVSGPATPMTPMTPHSADPGLLPVLQYVLTLFLFVTDHITHS